MYYRGADPLCEGPIMGKELPGHSRRHSAVSCAKMAEPIDLPFGLSIRVGRRKQKFNSSTVFANVPSLEGTLAQPGEYD